MFGELALLYNVPRAATITAKEKCVLWSLDRETFNNIVKDAAMYVFYNYFKRKRRETYEDFISKVKLLMSLESYEKSQLADALKIQRYNSGECIIKEGDEGNTFYILEEGEAYATKIISAGIYYKLQS